MSDAFLGVDTAHKATAKAVTALLPLVSRTHYAIRTKSARLVKFGVDLVPWSLRVQTVDRIIVSAVANDLKGLGLHNQSCVFAEAIPKPEPLTPDGAPFP